MGNTFLRASTGFFYKFLGIWIVLLIGLKSGLFGQCITPTINLPDSQQPVSNPNNSYCTTLTIDPSITGHPTGFCLNLSHTYQGDLSIRVMACGNTLMLLTRPGGGSCNAGAPFGSPADLGGQYCFYDTGPDPDIFLPLAGGTFGLSSDRCNINTVNSFAELAAACGDNPYELLFCITDHANANTGLASNITPIFPNPAVCGCTNPAATNYNPDANVDNGSCIFPPCQLTLSAVTIPESCDQQNGAIQLNISGGSGNQTIDWSNGMSGASLTNLLAGTYTVTVSDIIPNCTAIASFIVDILPPIDIEVEWEDTTCGESNGTAQVQVVAGIGPNYQYQWSEFWMPATLTQNNLPPGNYSVTVTDMGTGCTAEVSFDILPSMFPSVIEVIEHTSCGETNGSVVLDVLHGSGYYTFVWNDSSLEGDYLDQLAPGDYQVTITDEIFGCELIYLFSIFASDAFLIDVDTVGTTCGLDNGTIFISILQGIGPFYYEWNGLAPTNSPLAEQVPYGIYGIEVIDNNSGCSQYVEVEIAESEGFFAYPNVSNSSCGLPNGSVHIITELGSGQFTYAWEDFPNHTASIKDDLSGGEYTVTVTDDITSCVYVVDALVESSVPLEIEVALNSTTCGSNNGSISLTILHGSDNFNFEWNPSLPNLPSVNNLAPGSYQVTVTDVVLGCVGTAALTIASSEALEGAIDILPTTCGEVNGALTVSILNGTGPFTYQWTNGQSPQSNITNLTGGLTYDVTTTDTSDGCQWTGSATVPDSDPLLLSFTVDSLICGSTDARIQVHVSNSSGNLTYQWSGYAGVTGASLDQIGAGDYMVVVQDLDRMCMASATVNIPTIDSLTAICNVLQQESILGTEDGTAELQILHGQSDFMIILSGPRGDTIASNNRLILLDNLPPGAYTVEIEDNRGCFSSCGFEILPGPCGFAFESVDIRHVSCYGGTDGSIVLTTNSTTPLVFNWDSDQLEPIGNQLQLTAGNYSVTITDILGCQIDTTLEITQSPLLTLSCTVSQDETFKGLNDGRIQLQMAGGTAPYTVSIERGGAVLFTQVVNTSGMLEVDNLAPGTYEITLLDSQGCIAVCNQNVLEGPCGLQVTNIVSHVSCFGQSDGSVHLAISQAIGPVQIEWLNLNPSAITIGSTAVGLQAGNIRVQVTDSVNCTITLDVMINQPQQMALQCLAMAESAALAGDGSIGIQLMHYTAPFTVSLSGSSSAQITESDPTQVRFEYLVPGTYIITVTDANGCEASCTAIVNPADCTLKLDVIEVSALSCFQSSNGIIEVAGVDGTGILRYLWNGVEIQDGFRRTGLSAGEYVIQVIDFRGCSDELRITLSEPTRLLVSADVTDPTCGVDNGIIELQIVGGTPDYTITWQDATPDKLKTNLSAGAYSITVTDANACSSQLNIGLVMQPGPEIVEAHIQPIRCNGDNNGAIDINIQSITANLQVTWSNGINGETSIHELSPGAYQVTIIDDNGCQITDQYIITEPADLSFNSLVELGPCGTQSENTVILQVVGGTPPYRFLGDLQGMDTVFYQVPSGRQTFTIQDQNACTLSGEVFIIARDLPIVDAGPDLSISCRDSVAVLFAESYTDTLSVRWMRISGQLLTTDWSVSVTDPGMYIFEIEDTYTGCIARDTTEIWDNRSAITFVDLVYEDPSCRGADDAYIRIAEIEGGTAPFQILFNGQITTASTWQQLPPGTFTIEIEDSNGCNWPTEHIQLINPDTFYVNLPRTMLVDRGTSLTLDPVINLPDRVSMISWIANDQIICDNCTSTSLTRIYHEQEQVKILLTDYNGCVATARTDIFVRKALRIYIPEAFTPNGDGTNDHFFIYGDEYLERITSMEVFDRWGSMVFKTTDLSPQDDSQGWDGTFRGRPALPGVYVYYIKVLMTDGAEETFYGDVILIR